MAELLEDLGLDIHEFAVKYRPLIDAVGSGPSFVDAFEARSPEEIRAVADAAERSVALLRALAEDWAAARLWGEEVSQPPCLAAAPMAPLDPCEDLSERDGDVFDHHAVSVARSVG